MQVSQRYTIFRRTKTIYISKLSRNRISTNSNGLRKVNAKLTGFYTNTRCSKHA
ncbi:hypothetical protein HanPSC8_Chr13g0571691 [Helianthus annuus]|nr:hypothetical protein HanPSC8_Chr13g0571691 [Helianthus annuus]